MSQSHSIIENDELAQEYEESTGTPAAGDQNTEDPKPDNVSSGGSRKRINWSSVRDWLKSYAFFVYSSQALSAWGDRMWSFAVGLYLVEIGDSLQLTAVYGLCLTASVFCFGAIVGRWVDRTPRLRAVQISLFLQNSFVMVNAGIMCIMLVMKEDIPSGVYVVLQVSVILLGVVAKLAGVAEKISVQKDWIVVIAGTDKSYMAEMNASVRRIDLTVNILAPIIVGQIMTFASMVAAGIFIAAWNLVSMFVEYLLLLNVYWRVPALAEKKQSQPKSSNEEQGEEGQTGEEQKEVEPSSETPPVRKRRWNPLVVVVNWVETTYDGLKIYSSYDVSWAAFGLACLYMTVMGFNSVTTGYGYALGVKEYMLGIIRALGSLAGIVGTVMFTFLRKRIGIVRSGLYCICTQIAMLTLCVGSVFADGSPFEPRFVQIKREIDNGTVCLASRPEEVESHWSAGLFFAGMVLSRIGLWAFDLVVSQLTQETVVEEHRGVFNGIQNSLQSCFDMIHFILVIGLPCAESFGYLIMLSFCFVCFGALMYAVFSYKRRGHILPHQLKECIPGSSSNPRVRLRGII